jgi:hypothetical protein
MRNTSVGQCHCPNLFFVSRAPDRQRHPDLDPIHSAGVWTLHVPLMTHLLAPLSAGLFFRPPKSGAPGPSSGSRVIASGRIKVHLSASGSWAPTPSRSACALRGGSTSCGRRRRRRSDSASARAGVASRERGLMKNPRSPSRARNSALAPPPRCERHHGFPPLSNSGLGTKHGTASRCVQNIMCASCTHKSRLVTATRSKVRFGPLCGLKSDISRGPTGANNSHSETRPIVRLLGEILVVAILGAGRHVGWSCNFAASFSASATAECGGVAIEP